jgi:hypothetical protein
MFATGRHARPMDSYWPRSRVDQHCTLVGSTDEPHSALVPGVGAAIDSDTNLLLGEGKKKS